MLFRSPPAAAPPPPAAKPKGAGLFGVQKDTYGQIAQVLMALSSGLLSRGYGESGFEAFGRGLAGAQQTLLQTGRQKRKKRTRERLMELAGRETISPEDREIYSIMAEMEDPGTALGAFIQNRGAEGRAQRSIEAADARARRSHRWQMERADARRATPRLREEDYVYTVMAAKRGDPEARVSLGLNPRGTDITDEMQLSLDEWRKMSPLDTILRMATQGAAYPGLGGGPPRSQFPPPGVE